MRSMATAFLAFTAYFMGIVFSATEKTDRSHQPGDITIGGLFLLHYSTENGNCGEFFPIGLGHVAAMIFALDKINKDPKLLPNVTLGYDIRDYCESTAKAMKHTYDFVRRNDFAFNSNKESCSRVNESNLTPIKRTPIAAVIGPTDSGSAVVAGSLLEVAGIPVISHSATSNELSSPQYRHFFRTAPPDDQQTSAMADIIQHFNWSFVAVVAMDDFYGRNGLWELEKQAEKRKTFCIAFAEYIPRQEYSGKLTRAVSKIKSYPNIRVVLLWLFGGYGRRFLKEAVKQKLEDRTWILSDALAAEDDVFAGLKEPEQPILRGSLGIQPRHLEIPNFETFVIQEIRYRVPWWEEFLKSQDNLNCSSTGRKNLSGCQKLLPSTIFDTYLPYVVDAVFAVAHALHQMEICSTSKGTTPGKGDKCRDSSHLPLDPQEVERYLQEVYFQGLTGRVSFDSSGDPVWSSYDIVHFQRSNSLSDQRHPVKVVIGSWVKGRRPQLRLNDTNIAWNTPINQTVIPKSFCHGDCPPGTFRSRTTACCWECIRCPAGTLSILVNSVNCTKCPRGQMPNEGRWKCLDLPEVESKWSSITSVLIILFASVGFSLVSICGAILYKYRNTPLVKAANRELSFILLITISLSFSVSVLTLAKPTNLTCSLGVCWRSTVLVTFISILILKTMKILSAFRINVIAERFKKFILAAKRQSFLVIALISVHVFLLLLWITLDPPHQERTIQPIEGNILLSCSLYHSSVGRALQIAITVYISFLAVICTFYAFKARSLPENFNEARYIVFSMYILLLSCVAYYPLDIGLTGTYATNLKCVGTLLSSYALLACMFGPKIYIILRQPEKNTHEAVSWQVSEYSFSSNYKGKINVAPINSDTNISQGYFHQEFPSVSSVAN